MCLKKFNSPFVLNFILDFYIKFSIFQLQLFITQRERERELLVFYKKCTKSQHYDIKDGKRVNELQTEKLICSSSHSSVQFSLYT